MTGDPNRERCGNCGGTPWEEHGQLQCAECREWFRLCDLSFVLTDDDEALMPPNDCGQHDSSKVFRPESDEDRIADRAGARGMNL